MIVDVNVNLSRWPFRRTPCDELPPLLKRLDRWQISEAWTGSLDGLFHRDLGAANARLAQDCASAGRPLVPFGSVNPTLPDWKEDLRRCHEQHHMPGIRLHPNYHGYKLDDPAFAELLDLAQARGLIVELAVRMDDDRVQHPLMRVPDVDLKPLAEVIANRPKLPLILLNALRSVVPAEAARLSSAGNVFFEISMLEGVGGVEKLIAAVSAQRVLFGSHLPLFNLESAVLKLQESRLSEEQMAAVTSGNARRLVRG